MSSLSLSLSMRPLNAGGVATGVPVNTVAPAISGIQTVGQTLTMTNGSWTQFPTSFARKWQSANDGAGTGAADIAGETGSTYVIGALTGKYVRSGVQATNSFGPDVAGYVFSAWGGPVAATPAITGTPATTGTVGAAYSFTPGKTGGHGSGSYAMTGTIGASGLSFSSVTGALTAASLGPAATYGPFDMTWTDDDGITSAALGAWSITVSVASAFSFPLSLEFMGY